MADKPITRLASEMATQEQKKKRGFFDKVGGFFADAGQEVGRMVTNPLETAQRVGSMAKQTFVDPIVNLPNAFDPTSGLSPLERVNTGLGGGLALADAFTPFLPEGALANALANRAASKAWANHVPTINKPRLLPGQGYGLHVSHQPNLTVIQDIEGLRNTGGNFGTIYDSTQFVDKGATYAFGIPQGSPGQRQVDAALEFALDAKRAAAQNPLGPENRNYTMYFTQTNPIDRPGPLRTTRLADPEYGTHNPFVDRGESIYGDQKVLSNFGLDIDAYTAPRNALENSPLAQSTSQADALKWNEELLKVMNFEDEFRKNLYNRVSMEPMFNNYLVSIEREKNRIALQKAARERLASRKAAERSAKSAASNPGDRRY
jgi:hypothetical protein